MSVAQRLHWKIVHRKKDGVEQDIDLLLAERTGRRMSGAEQTRDPRPETDDNAEGFALDMTHREEHLYANALSQQEIETQTSALDQQLNAQNVIQHSQHSTLPETPVSYTHLDVYKRQAFKRIKGLTTKLVLAFGIKIAAHQLPKAFNLSTLNHAQWLGTHLQARAAPGALLSESE